MKFPLLFSPWLIALCCVVVSAQPMPMMKLGSWGLDDSLGHTVASARGPGHGVAVIERQSGTMYSIFTHRLDTTIRKLAYQGDDNRRVPRRISYRADINGYECLSGFMWTPGPYFGVPSIFRWDEFGKELDCVRPDTSYDRISGIEAAIRVSDDRYLYAWVDPLSTTKQTLGIRLRWYNGKLEQLSQDTVRFPLETGQVQVDRIELLRSGTVRLFLMNVMPPLSGGGVLRTSILVLDVGGQGNVLASTSILPQSSCFFESYLEETDSTDTSVLFVNESSAMTKRSTVRLFTSSVDQLRDIGTLTLSSSSSAFAQCIFRNGDTILMGGSVVRDIPEGQWPRDQFGRPFLCTVSLDGTFLHRTTEEADDAIIEAILDVHDSVVQMVVNRRNRMFVESYQMLSPTLSVHGDLDADHSAPLCYVVDRDGLRNLLGSGNDPDQPCSLYSLDGMFLGNPPVDSIQEGVYVVYDRASNIRRVVLLHESRSL